MVRDFTRNDSLNTKEQLEHEGLSYSFFNLNKAAEKLNVDLSELPNTLKILFENLLRHEDGDLVKFHDIEALATQQVGKEIFYYPGRVLMQDFTGVPAIVDLAAMRDSAVQANKDPKSINPQIPVDLIIDHSVQVDKYASPDALSANVKIEVERNKERYQFLKWGQQAFDNFKVVPPGTGICHQVNLEYLAKVAQTEELHGEHFIYPDTLVGTDSHTTMINSLSVLGWGVGGIEAEAALLGQPISMKVPEVIGFELTGALREGTTATDLVLTITQMLREEGVVGKFVEFCGAGLAHLSLADRATISNMSPEFGATCAFFPIDGETLKYLRQTARAEEHIKLVEKYAKLQGLWHNYEHQPKFQKTLKLNLANVTPSLAGPKRPQDKVDLNNMPEAFAYSLADGLNLNKDNEGKEFTVREGEQEYSIKNGDVVIAAITSCTNTSNPSVMIGAGLLARNAIKKGLKVKPWVKTSFAPGSKVVSEYLRVTNLQNDLDRLGFNLVGYGCTTCIGNSGPLKQVIAKTIEDNDLVVASVLSGNRNFEGRIHPSTRANYLASPLLCVAYAIAGTVYLNLTEDPLGYDKDNTPIYLKDIWPSKEEIEAVISSNITPSMFEEKYGEVFKGDDNWHRLEVAHGDIYAWGPDSTYIKRPSFFDGRTEPINDIKSARILAIFGDSITTDHISPAGAIPASGPAGTYLQEHGIAPRDFNSYGSRRGNHEVMQRGTFANIRIKNELAGGKEGGYSMHINSDHVEPLYDVAMRYIDENIPTVVIAGKEYGTGSSRDWAAKGTLLLGVKAVIAESFERIHRSNLVGMGILPLSLKQSKDSPALNGDEQLDILIPQDGLKPGCDIQCHIKYANGQDKTITLKCRLDTEIEIEYYKAGGILRYVMQNAA